MDNLHMLILQHAVVQPIQQNPILFIMLILASNYTPLYIVT